VTEWIVIPNWSRYQHYNDRAPAWIKDHLSQLNDDTYVELSLSQRGLLANLRLLYAASDGRCKKSALSVSQKLGQRVTERQLDALRDAGFIQFSASRPLALTRARERALEEKREEKIKAGRASTRTSKSTPPADVARQNATAYTPNGEPETLSAAVDAEMLALAHGWLGDHTSTSSTTDDAATTDDDELEF
jgi:hypothetical protein